MYAGSGGMAIAAGGFSVAQRGENVLMYAMTSERLRFPIAYQLGM